MELKGYIPRIGATTARPVERCLTPSLLADDTHLPELVMVDGWWAATDTVSLPALRRAKVGVLLDTQAWRMTTADVLEMPKANRLPHLPAVPFTGAPDKKFDDFVRRDIEFQIDLDVAAIIVPGRIPKGPKDEVWPWIHRSVEVATTMPGVDRPMIGMLGLHSQRLIQDAERTRRLSGALTGLILQVTPFNPLKMRPASLLAVIEAIDAVQDGGFEVVVRSGVGLGPLIQALGLGAHEGGLADGESFSLSSLVRTRRPGKKAGGPIGSRRYVEAIRRSVSAKEWAMLTSAPGLRNIVTGCSAACCRFKPPDALRRFGRDHAWHARLRESHRIQALSAPLRMSQLRDDLVEAQGKIRAINRDLTEQGGLPFDEMYLANWLAVCDQLEARRHAA